MTTRSVWDFYGALGEDARHGLTATEQPVAAICDLRQEVNAGGFDSYFRYGGGNTAPAALAGLPTTLGPEWAVLLTEALGLFGESYPMDPDARADVIDDLQLDQAFEDLGHKFLVLEGQTDADTLLCHAIGGSTSE